MNDTPHGAALAALRAAGEATDRIRLGAGVLPLDRRPVEQIASSLAGLPQQRLVLGLGAGAGGAGSLARVRDAILLLRERTQAEVVVGALGPRMRRLAAEEADGVLLNWLPPGLAAEQRDELHRAAAGRPRPRATLYVRTIVDAGARPALEREAERYAAVPAYAANFERHGFDPLDTTLTSAIAGNALRYRSAVDELVLRAVVADADDLDAHLRFVAVAAADVRP